MDEIFVSDSAENSAYITYLYNCVMTAPVIHERTGELEFGERAVMCIRTDRAETIRSLLIDKISDVLGVGYKYHFLKEHLSVSLPAREYKLLCAALIAADLEGDRAYIRGKLERYRNFSLDGLYRFRLAALREKWEHILTYIPIGFSYSDLKHFCDFLVGESKKKVYVKGREVFGENFVRLRRSVLLGQEELETEIMLADAGFVYCLGRIEDSLSDFLQKYYAERAVFS